MTALAAPINIFSGESGLGAALTNPTELGREKGRLSRSYPILFQNKRYRDVETAYHQLGESLNPSQKDTLMVELIAAKFHQHQELANAVCARGGALWLEQCSHFTGARTDQAKSWEGAGLESRFIRNLVQGYKLFEASGLTQFGQQALF